MDETGVEEVMVIDTFEEKHLLGIVSNDDIFQRAKNLDEAPSSLSIEACMKPIHYMVRENAPLEDCQRFMEENHLTRVAVVDSEGHLRGIYDQEKLMRNLG